VERASIFVVTLSSSRRGKHRWSSRVATKIHLISFFEFCRCDKLLDRLKIVERPSTSMKQGDQSSDSFFICTRRLQRFKSSQKLAPTCNVSIKY
jgi:hypothetical protein